MSTGVDGIDLFTLVGVHEDETGRRAPSCPKRRSGDGLAPVDTDPEYTLRNNNLTDKRVGHDLEDQRRQRRVVTRLASQRLAGRRLEAPRPPGDPPATADTSRIPSSNRRTPLFLKAEPPNTGTMSLWMVPRRSAALDHVDRDVVALPGKRA